MNKQYITKEGLEKLRVELEELKKQKMPDVVERIARARELGDLSENAEYQDAKDEQAFLAGRIAELENLIDKSELISEGGSREEVEVGCTVRVQCGEQKFEYTIVGSNEADPSQGLVSNESPIGKAFIGKKKGEEGVIQAPKGPLACTILEIK
jgi:transcription elongation factor GreA